MDWIDPNTWKVPAALIDYWRIILPGAVTILGAVATIARWGLKPFRWLYAKVRTRLLRRRLKRPLRFVQVVQQSFWGPAGMGKEQGTQVAGEWHVTNVSDRNVVLLRARIKGHESHFIDVATAGLRHDKAYHPLTPIPAERMGRVTAHFVFFPPIISVTGPLKADVIFTDNYEEEHHVKSVFRFIRAQPGNG